MKHLNNMASWIEKMAKDPDVNRITPLSRDLYFVRFQDASARLYTKFGDHVRSSIDNYEFITDFKRLGDLDGRAYFAFKGRDYSCSEQNCYEILNERGKDVHFKNPRFSGFEQFPQVQEAFGKLQQLSAVFKEQHSVHTASEQLITMDDKQSLHMRHK